MDPSTTDGPIDGPTREQKRQLWKAIRRERNIEALDALRKQRFSPTEVIKKGARYGNLPFLKDYLDSLAGGTFHGLQKGRSRTNVKNTVKSLRRTQYLPWIEDTRIMKTAIKHGHTETARYLYDKGFTRERQMTFFIAVRNGDLKMIQTFTPKGGLMLQGIIRAARAGHKHILEWFEEKGGELESYMCTDALERGHLECAKWIAERACCAGKYSVTSCSKEDGGTHIRCLEGALRAGLCAFAGFAERVAAVNLECLRYIDGIGCNLTATMFRKAVVAWNVPCMEYLHEKKCPWTNDMILDAISIGNAECIEWLKSRGYSAYTCPGDSQGSL